MLQKDFERLTKYSRIVISTVALKDNPNKTRLNEMEQRLDILKSYDCKILILNDFGKKYTSFLEKKGKEGFLCASFNYDPKEEVDGEFFNRHYRYSTYLKNANIIRKIFPHFIAYC
jgi:hypothetical protein